MLKIFPNVVITDGYQNLPNVERQILLETATDEQLDQIAERCEIPPRKYRSYTRGLGFHTARESIRDRILWMGFICYENTSVRSHGYWQKRLIEKPVVNILKSK